jgi:hypothetical protein
MDWHLYLRKGVLYLPTTGIVEAGLYRNIEPVAVVPISNTEGVRAAIRATIAQGNPTTPHFSGGKYPKPILLKYAGVKNWSEFARVAVTWTIEEKDGSYRIIGYRKHAKGYWERDPDNQIAFPNGSALDDVIDRMIEILLEPERS